MPRYTANTDINLNLNAKQASKMLNSLKQQTAELEKKFKAAEAAGNKVQMKRLRQQINENNRLMRLLQTETAQVAEVMNRLNSASPKELRKTLSTLQNQLNGMKRGTEEFRRQCEMIRRVRNEINSVNASLSQSQSMWSRVRSGIMTVQNGVLAVTAALSGMIAAGKHAVQEFAKMEEAETDTRKFTGLDAAGVRELNNEFKKMNTRTAREQLNELAQEAGRLGKNTQESIMGYVKGADVLNVALSDLGAGATEKVAKLNTIFNIEDQYGTYESMLKVGSVINVLSQNCTASKPYLVEFTNRMAGVGAQAGMTVQDIIGLAAVLDSNAQACEASATAVSQILTRLYQEPAKYAKVAGMDAAKFTETIKKDANEGLLMFLSSLSKAKDLSVLSPMFKDMGENGARMIASLSTLAKNIDEVRRQQANANQAFEEGTSVLNEYNLFNNTTQAGFDKAKKDIKELAIGLGEKLAPVMRYFLSSSSIMLRVLSTMVDYFSKNKTEIIIISSALAAYAVAANLAAIKTALLNARLLITNKLYAATSGVAKVLSLIYAGLHNAVQYFTNGLSVNYAMQQRWNKAMSAMKFSTWAGAILTIGVAVYSLVKHFSDARIEAEKVREEFVKIENEAAQAAATELKTLEALYNKSQDQNVAMKDRIAAVNKLRELYPDYFKDLSDEAILAGQAAGKYRELAESILSSARARGKERMIEQYEQRASELEEKYDKEARPFIEQSMKARANAKFNLNGGLSFDDDPAYKLAQNSLAILDKKYLEEARRLRKRQNELAKDVADFKVNEKPGGSTDKEDPDGIVSSYSSSKEAEKERKKREREARAAALKASKEFKAALKKIKGDRDLAEAQAKASYISGAVDYRRYLDMLREAEVNFYKDSEQLYISNNLQEDADYKALLEKKEDATRKYNEQKLILDKHAVERLAAIEEQEAKARYQAKTNPTLTDELAMRQEILDISLRKLQDIQKLYEKGSKEFVEYEEKIEDLLSQDRLDKQKLLMQKVADFEKQYNKLSVKEKYDLERKALKTLFDEKMISEQKYRDWLAKLDEAEKNDRRVEKNDLPGSSPIGGMASGAAAREKYNREKKELDKALADGVIDDQEYNVRLVRIKNELWESLISPLKECKSEWVSLMSTMIDSWADFADALKDPEANPFNALAKGIEATAALTSAIMSQVSEFTKAQMEIQEARIEKRYAAELKFAEGNAYLTKKLEREKQKELAEMKSEEANRAFAMQVIGAVAQTASNAISAYGAALKIGPAGLVLAPIAAGLAVAQGAVQIATINKQKEAAAAKGYSEGGFTRKGAKDEPAGIVHAGEWVASQKLVNSPVARPILNALEYAQRTNRIASLSMEDVSSSVIMPARRAVPEAQPQQLIISREDNSNNPELARLSSVIARLEQRLDEPIVARSYVAGDGGSKEANDKYDRMIANKSRKSRRYA